MKKKKKIVQKNKVKKEYWKDEESSGDGYFTSIDFDEGMLYFYNIFLLK